MSEPFDERLDRATADRLERLGQRPIDTARLEQRLAAALRDEAQAERGNVLVGTSSSRMRITGWLRPAASLAAVFALVVGLAITLNTSTPRASAAVLKLSTLHHELVAGRLDITPATTIEQANRRIAEQRASAPALPGGFEGVRVQSCCLVDVQGRLAAVAVLQDGEVLITLVVAQAPDFAHEMGVRIDIDGRRFFGHELDGVRMMMANRGDRWLCVMGDRSYERLARLAADAEF
ncbi:MAG: hypothetical protein RLN76_04100 [Phycisphaeraceae bacterium]